MGNYILGPNGEFVSADELYHHGIKGMKWGVRRYQNKDGSLTPAGKKRVRKVEKLANKKENKLAEKAKKVDRLAKKTEKLANKKSNKLAEKASRLSKKVERGQQFANDHAFMNIQVAQMHARMHQQMVDNFMMQQHVQLHQQMFNGF